MQGVALGAGVQQEEKVDVVPELTELSRGGPQREFQSITLPCGCKRMAPNHVFDSIVSGMWDTSSGRKLQFCISCLLVLLNLWL